MKEALVNKDELLVRVTLPLGNFCHILKQIIEGEDELSEEEKTNFLCIVLANAQGAYDFLMDFSISNQKPPNPKTPDQLRLLVEERMSNTATSPRIRLAKDVERRSRTVAVLREGNF